MALLPWNGTKEIFPLFITMVIHKVLIYCPVFLLLMSLKDSCLNKCKCLLFTSKVVLFHQTNLDLNQEICINQPIAITNKIYKSSERELEQRGDSLDISKT